MAFGCWIQKISCSVIPGWSGYNYSTSGTTTYTALTPNVSAPIIVSGADIRVRENGITVVRTDTINTALGQGNVSVIASGSITAGGWEIDANYPNHYINYNGTNKLTLQAGAAISLFSSRFSIPNGTLELLAGTQISQTGPGIAGAIYANNLILGSSNGGVSKPSVSLVLSSNLVDNIQASNVSSLAFSNARNLAVNANGLSVTGAVSLTVAGNLTVNGSISTSAAPSAASVTLKSTNNISLSDNRSITTNGGGVTFWSDSDGNGSGYVQLQTGSSINSSGGHITLGGGANLATGYARGEATRDTVTEPTHHLHISGVNLQSGTSISSGGGDITLRGENSGGSPSVMSFGVMSAGTTIDSGTGKVAITGKATGSGNINAQALSYYSSGWVIRSANTTAQAITLVGDASNVNGTNSSLGINFSGTVEATGVGGGHHPSRISRHCQR